MNDELEKRRKELEEELARVIEAIEKSKRKGKGVKPLPEGVEALFDH